MHKKRVLEKLPGFMQAPASSRKLPQAHEKVCNENERNKEKLTHAKNVIDGRKHFIGRLHKTGEDNWDKLQTIDSGHNEGTICLVNG